MYEIRFTSAAEKYFKKVKEKKLLNEYREAINKISKNPYSGEIKKGNLAGIYCYNVYYSSVNNEIAYRIFEQNEKFIVVILAGTRENFYQQLKRYIDNHQIL
jgi:mRNA interferase RelE/StbE